jgi:hypothetical protein
MAERSGRVAAQEEADRWRALAEAAEAEARRSRWYAILGVAAGTALAVLSLIGG